MAFDVTTINTTCPMCRKVTPIQVSTIAYSQWKSGQLIQLAFPELSPDQREALVSGICPECWDKMFAEPEEGDEEEKEN